jgi:F-box interacting protein
MESVGEEILREILFKLPTTDLAGSCCVCKLWHAVVSDTSFRTLHGAARHVVRAEAETLLVPEFRVPSIGLEMTVIRVSSAKPVCRFTDLAGCYIPTNACNGFLLLAPRAVEDWPVYVCNPVTGEKLKIPAPPKIEDVYLRMYAMGSSPSTGEYKLFRLSLSEHGWTEKRMNQLDVYTLGGDNAGWRRHPYMFAYRAVYGLYLPPPVLLDGKLYVVMERPPNYEAPDRILVIDVASEAHFALALPENFTRNDRAAVHTFELCGQLCVAVHVFGQRHVDLFLGHAVAAGTTAHRRQK